MFMWQIPRLSIRLKVYDLLKINANTGDKDLLISYIKSIENIPLLVVRYFHKSKHIYK